MATNKDQNVKAYDHYIETKELAGMLRKENLNGYADAILMALEEGSTGTEIFMALRWNIKNIIDAKHCSVLTEAKALRLYQELDKALQ